MGPKRKLNTGGGSRTSSHNKTTTTAATTIGTDGRNKSTQVVEGTGTTITKGQGGGDNTTGSTNELPQSAGYLISCDVPTKQFIVSLEKDKDFGIKNFILEDLDPTHLLVKKQARSKIEGRVEKWMDDVRIYYYCYYYYYLYA